MSKIPATFAGISSPELRWQKPYLIASGTFFAFACIAAAGAYYPPFGSLEFGLFGGAFITSLIASVALVAFGRKYEVHISGYREKFYQGTPVLRGEDGLFKQARLDLSRQAEVYIRLSRVQSLIRGGRVQSLEALKEAAASLTEEQQHFAIALCCQAGCADLYYAAQSFVAGPRKAIALPKRAQTCAYRVEIFKHDIQVVGNFQITYIHPIVNEVKLGDLSLTFRYHFDSDQAIIRWSKFRPTSAHD